MRKKYVLISLVSKEKMTKEPYGREILSLFYDQYSTLAPQFANFYEPINQPILTVDRALNFWDGETAGLYRRKNSTVGNWHISEDKNRVPWMVFEYNWSEKVDWFELFQKLIGISRAYFGYLHVFTDQEIEPAGIGSAIGCFLNGTPSIYLKKGIPQLAWGNYFGEEYVKEFNLPLLKKHGFTVESLGEGYVFNLTDQLSDVITNYDYFNERRKLLKSLFRPGLFQNYAKYEHES